MRVLVVDDDQDVRDLVARCVRSAGFEVLEAESGRTALEAVEAHGMPDVAVLDVAMPGMDGIELLGRLREQQSALPAVFLSVLWSGPDQTRMRAAGGVAMRKPFSAERLHAALRELTAGRIQDASQEQGSPR